MVIGRGDIGKAIKDREGFIFYANGCSNRLPLTEPLMNKEQGEIYKLSKEYEKEMFIYISTLSIYYSDSEYTKHKIRMERCVKRFFRNYCIFRIGNITWGDNPNTLINHLKKDQSRIEDVCRYLIDDDEMNHWLGMIPQTGKHEMNLTGHRLYISEIVSKIEIDAPLI